MKVKKLGHIALRVADEQRSKAFYRDVLGFRISEEDPEHGGVFMTLGDDFHTVDLFAHPDPNAARQTGLGLAHMAFQVGSYRELKDVYRSLVDHQIPISRAVDHISQRSIYFNDPDGNGLEVYYERPDALARWAGSGRGDEDTPLTVTGPGEPLPTWLDDAWPTS